MTTTVLAFIPSPSQGVWHLWFLPIRAYALCIIAGIIAALILGDRRWVARGGERGVIYDIALWAVPFGLIGGRLYHVMTDWQKYFGADGAGFLAALRIWDGGLGIWGAVALGGVGAWIACRRRGIPLPAFGDAVAPGIILAQAIGRLGNYFNQELYGRETDLPWGLTIYQRLDPSGVTSPHSLDGVSTGQVYAVVHPTFLYELLWNLAIFGLLLWADRRFNLGHGRLFALYVAGYCVGRFVVELMRSDTATLIAGIRVNTFTSTFVFIGAVIYIMVAPKGREDPETLRGKGVDQSRRDGLGEELVGVAATSGVVAAASVAGDEDEADEGAATSEFTGGADVESEAAAEAADLTRQVETASSEDIAEAEAFADAGEAAEEEREAGMGVVEGDQAVEAEVSAPEAHEVAVDGVARAESLAQDVAAEPETGDDATAPEGDAAEVHDGVVTGSETAGPASDEVTAPEAGLGSVDGDEVGAAEGDAAEVHDPAVAGSETAESATDDPTPPEAGLGSVDGDEVAAAEGDAAEVHEAAVAGSETAGPASDEVTAPEAGLGSVDGDEVAAAEGDAAEVHDAAVTGSETAESAADDVAAEPEPAPDEAEAPETTDGVTPPEAGLGSVDGDEVAAAEGDAGEVHEAVVAGSETAESAADDVAAEPEPAPDEAQASETTDGVTPPEAGLGSVDGDEVAAAEGDAAEVHDATVQPAKAAAPVRRRWWRRR